MTARLHVLIGAGGVGKTTLAAAYALALAEGGATVGLLGVDPSRRLADALGAELDDDARPIARPAAPGAPGGGGSLRAAIIAPHQAIARWCREAIADPADAARLAANPFFAALGDRLATATDILAAVRVAEWLEREPALDHLIVDTAPDAAAVELLRAPRQIEALLEGPMVRWLRAAAGPAGGARAGLFSGARRVVGVLGRLGGARLIGELASFFALVRAPLERMLARVLAAQRVLRGPDAELLLVTSPRDAGGAAARALAAAVAELHLRPRAVIVNRTWPAALGPELDAIAARAPDDGAALAARAAPLVAYARAQLAAQAATLAAVAALAPRTIALPARPELDRSDRAAPTDADAGADGAARGRDLAVLTDLGRQLARHLAAPATATAPAPAIAIDPPAPAPAPASAATPARSPS